MSAAPARSPHRDERSRSLDGDKRDYLSDKSGVGIV